MNDTSSWVVEHSLLQEFGVHNFVSVEGARHQDFLASDDNDSLSVEELLGDDGSESTKKMTFAVNNNFFLKH